ncbi:hypothetical protein ACLVWU_17620 [Bdellovibrio sp. HCB290]|uniref:hypothetical protein n=1 Tax=Bdellovibrio sp. HCB290 TaxID=3394356 RepID=UPI0039B53119
MKLLISALLLGLTLTACKPVEELEDDKRPDEIVNQTDYSSCNTNGGSTKTIIGSWYYLQGIGNTKFTKTFTFSRDYVRVTNDCTFDGVTVRATSTSRVMLSMGSASYLDSALNENTLQREGYKLVCQAKIEPLDLSYRFQGGCLVLVDQNSRESLTLLPVTK